MMHTDFVRHSHPQGLALSGLLASDTAPGNKSASVEKALVISAQSGSHAAFNALAQKYRQRVYKISLRYMRNHADAEDVVQDTLMKAYVGLRHFRGECAFYSWLHRIAINTAKTTIQILSRERTIESWTADEGTDSRAQGVDLDTPEDIALTCEICSAVDDAIGALSDDQRAAIVLREFYGNSYQEVADAMECPVGTVRSRVFRAREVIDQRVRQVFEVGLGRGHAKRAPVVTGNAQASGPG